MTVDMAVLEVANWEVIARLEILRALRSADGATSTAKEVAQVLL
jgi:hypothetical protein